MRNLLKRLLCCLLAAALVLPAVLAEEGGPTGEDGLARAGGMLDFNFDPPGAPMETGQTRVINVSFRFKDEYMQENLNTRLEVLSVAVDHPTLFANDVIKSFEPLSRTMKGYGSCKITLQVADYVEFDTDVILTIDVNGFRASAEYKVARTPDPVRLAVTCNDYDIDTDNTVSEADIPTVNLDEDETMDLRAQAYDSRDRPLKSKVDWYSTNRPFVSVDESGLVTCIKANDEDVVITASVQGPNGQQLKTKVKVSPKAKFRASFGDLEGGQLKLSVKDAGEDKGKGVLEVTTSPPEYKNLTYIWTYSPMDGRVTVEQDKDNPKKANVTVNVPTTEETIRVNVSVTAVDADTNKDSEPAQCLIVVEPPDYPLKGLRLETKDFPSTMKVGDARRLSAYYVRYDPVDPERNPEFPVPTSSSTSGVQWSSSNRDVARVNQDGTVTALKGGTTIITVRTKDERIATGFGFTNEGNLAEASFPVTVTQGLNKVSLPYSIDLRLIEGNDAAAKKELTVAFDPEDAHPLPDSIIWRSENQDIASVADTADRKKALITGKSPGTTKVTATATYSDNSSFTAECIVNVSRPVTGINVIEDDYTLELGSGPVPLHANYIPEGSSGKGIIWSSEDKNYVYVNQSTGMIEAKKATEDGHPIKIYAAVAGNTTLRDYCEVTVPKAPVTKVTIPGLKAEEDAGEGHYVATVSMGSSLQLVAQVEPAYASNQGIIWESRDISIATVKNGKVVPKQVTAEGKPVVITARSKDNDEIFATVKVTVTGLPLSGIRLDPPDPITIDSIPDSRTFKALLLPKGSDATPSWNIVGKEAGVLDDGIISISATDKTCVVTSKGPGESGIMASVGNFSASVKITVSGVQLGTKQDDGTFKTTYNVAAGSTLSIPRHVYGSAKLLPATDWEWLSADDSIARVNPSSGQITGVKPGTTEITCKNGSYSCKITVIVTQTSGNVIQKEMVLNDTRFAFSEIIEDLKKQCRDVLGEDLDYISSLFVDSSQGTLYYGHLDERDTGEGVASGDKFYLELSETAIKNKSALPQDGFLYKTGTPLDKLIKWIYFVPKKDFGGTEENTFAGIAEIDYAGYSASGKSYNATLRIIVKIRTEIPYNSSHGEAVRFRAADFSEDCKIRTGYPIYSVKFTAPSERYGYLCYDYTGGELSGSNVTDRRYFALQSEPSVEKVYFVPREGYTGSFPISFTGWNTEGKSYTGTIRVTVGFRKSDDAEASIVYKAVPGHRLYFDVNDFATLCKTSTGRTLDHIVFTTVPQDEKAALYNGSETRRIASGETYYYTTSSNRMLRNVNVLPDVDFTGPLTIAFEGYDISQAQFYGSVTIEVEKSGTRAADIYIESNGMPAVFRRADFTEACKDALKGELKSVRFFLPRSSSGTIYEHFSDLTDRTPLANGVDIDVSKLMELSFLPKGGFDGSCYISYIGKDADNNTCNGTLRVSVWPDMLQSYFKDMDNAAWAAQSVEFLRQYGVVSGSGKRMFRPSEGLKRGDFVLMLSRAYDFPLDGSNSFSDVPPDSYYAGAIATAKAMGLVKGSGSRGVFRPNEPITRQDAFTILYRLLLDKKLIEKENVSSISGFYDQSSVASYAVEPISALVRNGLIQGSGNRIYPTSSLTRAEMAVILHRALT